MPLSSFHAPKIRDLPFAGRLVASVRLWALGSVFFFWGGIGASDGVCGRRVLCLGIVRRLWALGGVFFLASRGVCGRRVAFEGVGCCVWASGGVSGRRMKFVGVGWLLWGSGDVRGRREAFEGVPFPGCEDSKLLASEPCS